MFGSNLPLSLQSTRLLWENLNNATFIVLLLFAWVHVNDLGVFFCLCLTDWDQHYRKQSLPSPFGAALNFHTTLHIRLACSHTHLLSRYHTNINMVTIFTHIPSDVELCWLQMAVTLTGWSCVFQLEFLMLLQSLCNGLASGGCYISCNGTVMSLDATATVALNSTCWG